MLLKPVSWYKDLRKTDGRVAAKAFLVEGLRAIEQILKVAPESVCEIIALKNAPQPEKSNAPIILVNEKQLNAICPSQAPSGACAVVRLPENIYSQTLPQSCGPKILLLEDIQDPGNVGTLVRCAAGFGFDGLLLSRGCADPFAPKAIAASAGSICSVWVRRSDCYLEQVKKLRADGYTLIAADVRGNEHSGKLPDKNIICALGNEGAGLSLELLAMADIRLRIPQDRNRAESMNVAVCGGILMYLLSRNNG